MVKVGRGGREVCCLVGGVGEIDEELVYGMGFVEFVGGG